MLPPSKAAYVALVRRQGVVPRLLLVCIAALWLLLLLGCLWSSCRP